MKAALRDAKVAAAVKHKKSKRAVTPKPVKPSKYPRLAHDSARKGTLVVNAPRLRGTRAALSKKPPALGTVTGATHLGELPPRVKSPGKKRRAIRKWYRENVVGKVATVSRAAAEQKGTRTEAARAKKRAT
ncbi:MAG: hypothetical protein JWM87_790 [Candidatus Eremiobacteraeota bacterium]|nr:hypothetical protein [Candidatus Eremiobacteraeota bacterium]